MSTRNGRVRGASHELVSAARELRAGQTPAECILWEALRGRKLGGFKFRRQYPVGRHILDFVCVERRVVVELDGAHHGQEDQHRYDQERTEHLEQYGYQVVRFPNAVVLNDLDAVLDQIRVALASGKVSS
jgi:very-short-patch-repair endonuclease